jgi:hypothetical protein
MAMRESKIQTGGAKTAENWMDLGTMDNANGSTTDEAYLFLGARGGQPLPRS